MIDLEQTQEDIFEEFSEFESSIEAYQHLNELATMLPDYDSAPNDHVVILDELDPEIDLKLWMKDGGIEFTAKSTKQTVEGILYCVYDLLAGLPPTEVAHSDVYFVEEFESLGFNSETLSNVMQAIEAIQEFAAERS